MAPFEAPLHSGLMEDETLDVTAVETIEMLTFC
jgi:hypothetical protein